MEDVAHFAEKARQCRRLLRATNDVRTIEGLTALAEEFEAKAKSAEASTHAASLLGNGVSGSWTPVDTSDPN